MKIKELRVIYSAPIFNAGGGLAFTLSYRHIKKVI
jgi:hypothetical protein